MAADRIALVDGLLEPIRLRVEFPEDPVVNRPGPGSAERIAGLELLGAVLPPGAYLRCASAARRAIRSLWGSRGARAYAFSQSASAWSNSPRDAW